MTEEDVENEIEQPDVSVIVIFCKKIRTIQIPNNPDFGYSGFFESCRARYELSVRTLDAKLSFGGKIFRQYSPEENWRPDFLMYKPYRSFSPFIKLVPFPLWNK